MTDFAIITGKITKIILFCQVKGQKITEGTVI